MQHQTDCFNQPSFWLQTLPAHGGGRRADRVLCHRPWNQPEPEWENVYFPAQHLLHEPNFPKGAPAYFGHSSMAICPFQSTSQTNVLQPRHPAPQPPSFPKGKGEKKFLSHFIMIGLQGKHTVLDTLPHLRALTTASHFHPAWEELAESGLLSNF